MLIASSILRASALSAVALLLTSGAAFAQHDPGLRGGPPGAGAPLRGLTPIELSVFNEGIQRAIQLEAVCDDCTDVQLGSHVGVPLILLPKVPVAEWRFSAELCSRGLQPIDWQSSSVRCGERVLVD